MDTILQKQVDSIRQTFGYVEKYRDKVFVIKIDSSLIGHDYFPIFIRDVVLLHKSGIKIVLVPGTQQRIDEILSSFNIEYNRVSGKRITSDEAIPFVKMAAFDVSNKIMTTLSESSANAVIGNWVRARGIGVLNGVDFQSTGVVDKIDVDSIRGIIDDDMIPIFPNIGWSLRGRPYNISSNDLALQISVSLKAEKLFFITVDSGVKADRLGTSTTAGTITDDGTISQITVKEAKGLLAQSKEVESADYELLSKGIEAIKSGVTRVHILGGKVDGVLLKEIFSNIGFGTMVYSGDFDNIRAATHHDIPDILRITEELVEKGTLIKRSFESVENAISEYVVYEVDDTIHGCGGLKLYGESSAEVYSIAVDSAYSSMGVGKKLISYLVNRAIKIGLKRVFLLTTQTTDWFLDRGFVAGSVEELPEDKQKIYNYERMSRVLFLDLTDSKQYSKLISD